MEKVIYLCFAQGTNINGSLLAQNVSAIMIRAGQGNWEDPLFRYNYKLCLDNHIPFGIWWFCQPDMAASYQVDAFMKVWNSLTVKPIVIAYDVEEIDYKDETTGKMAKLFPPSRQFNHDNVLKWCKDIAVKTGAKVGIYTRKLYFEAWTLDVPDWEKFWMWIAAWYLYTGAVEPALPWHWTTYMLHQYEGGGLGTPGVDPAQTCKERFNGTHEECLAFFGSTQPIPIPDPVGEKTMIYDTTVKQADRAPILFLDPVTDKHPIMSAIKLGGTAGVMIKIGGMDGDTHEMTTMLYSNQEYFQTNAKRAQEVGLPILAYWDLRGGGYHLEQQHNVGPLEADHWWESEIFKKILETLRINGAWSQEMTATDEGWAPFNAVVLGIWDGTAKNGLVPDSWQKVTLETVLKFFILLRGNGQFPNVPLIVQTYPGFVSLNKGEFATYLNNVKKDITLAFTQHVFEETPGPQLPNIATLWKTYRPLDSFEYQSTPTGYDAKGNNSYISMHDVSWKRFSIPEVTDNAGKNQFAHYYLFCKGIDALNIFLKTTGVVVVPPTPDPIPTPDPTTLVAWLQTDLAEFQKRKPGDSSASDRLFAIAITELQKLIAFVGFYLGDK